MASTRTGSRWLAVVNTGVTPLGTLQLEVVRVTTDTVTSSGLTILLVVTIAHASALAAGRRGARPAGDQEALRVSTGSASGTNN